MATFTRDLQAFSFSASADTDLATVTATFDSSGGAGATIPAGTYSAASIAVTTAWATSTNWSDDELGLAVRIEKSGGGILAAATAGGAYETLVARASAGGPYTTSAVSFTYFDTASTKADWDTAVIRYQQLYLKDKGGDGCYVNSGTVSDGYDRVTITYSGAVSVTVPVTGVEGTGQVDTADIAVEAKAVAAVTGVEATGQVNDGGGSGLDTYYFDASDSGPTDENSQWTIPANPFDGSIATGSALSAGELSKLSAGGTTAPTTGGTISQVRARVYSGVTNFNDELSWQIKSSSETLVDVTDTTVAGNAWRPYETLSAPTGVETFHFDASVAGPTDDNTDWLSDGNAFDGVLSLRASNTVPTSRLKGTGTNANASGTAITQVRARTYGYSLNGDTYGSVIHAEIFSSAELLGDAVNDLFTIDDWDSYVVLTAPTGGWTWAKLQALEVQFYGTETSTGATRRVYRTEIEVTTASGWTWQKVNDLEAVLNAAATVIDQVRYYSVEIEVTSAAGGTSVTVIGDANIFPTGVEATPAVGTIAFPIDVPVTGVEATGEVGSVADTDYIQTTYLDGSDHLTDTAGVWTNDANAADGSLVTYASTTTQGIGNDLDIGGIPSGIQELGTLDFVRLTSSIRAFTTGGQIFGGYSYTIISGGSGAVFLNDDILFEHEINDATGTWATFNGDYSGIKYALDGRDATGTLDELRWYGAEVEFYSVPTRNVTGAANVPVTGVEATGAVGTVTVDAVQAPTVPVTGVEATGAVGTVTVIEGAALTVPVTGVEATTAVGAVDTTADANVPVTGVFATGSVGTVTIDAVQITGWNTDIWSSGVWGRNLTGTPVPVTGVLATSGVGTVTVTTIEAPTVEVTGISATGNVGSVSITAVEAPTVAVTGLSTTGAVGTATVKADANASVTGLSATGSVGDVTVDEGSVAVNVPVTGVFGTGEIGSVGVTAEANVTLVGVEATGNIGTVTVTAIQTVTATVTGVEATGSVGAVGVVAGGSISVPVTGLSATGAVGDVTVTTIRVADVPVTGVEATGEVGDVTVSVGAGITVAVTGVSATTAVGTVTVNAIQAPIVLVTGVEATGEVGTVLATSTVDIPVTGVFATGSVGSVSVTTAADVTVSGIAATGEIGTVTTEGKATIIVSGLSATADVGSVTIYDPALIVPVTGVEATGSVGAVFVYGRHVPNQDPNYVDIDPTQNPNWIDAQTAQDPNWTEIIPTQDSDWSDGSIN